MIRIGVCLNPEQPESELKNNLIKFVQDVIYEHVVGNYPIYVLKLNLRKLHEINHLSFFIEEEYDGIKTIQTHSLEDDDLYQHNSQWDWIRRNEAEYYGLRKRCETDELIRDIEIKTRMIQEETKNRYLKQKEMSLKISDEALITFRSKWEGMMNPIVGLNQLNKYYVGIDPAKQDVADCMLYVFCNGIDNVIKPKYKSNIGNAIFVYDIDCKISSLIVSHNSIKIG